MPLVCGLLVFLGARMIDVLDREIELVLVPFGIAAELAAAVGEHAQQLGIVLLEEWQYPVVQQVGRGDRRLAVIRPEPHIVSMEPKYVDWEGIPARWIPGEAWAF